MTAREKFTKGERVRATDKILLRYVGALGTVRGFGRQGRTVRVLRDGARYIDSWHMDSWEPIAAQEAK